MCPPPAGSLGRPPRVLPLAQGGLGGTRCWEEHAGPGAAARKAQGTRCPGSSAQGVSSRSVSGRGREPLPGTSLFSVGYE